MWKIRQEGGYWLVVDGDVTDSRWLSSGAAEQRLAQLAPAREAMVAAAGDSEGRAWYAVLCVDEYLTADGRYAEHFEWETLPLTLWTLDQNSGHYDGEASGSIRTIERLSDGRRIYATGVLATTEEGLQTEQQIESQALRFVSVDPADVEAEEEITKIGTDGWPVESRIRFTKYVIGGATVVGNPAIRLAVIWLDGMEAPAEFTEVLPDPVPRVQVPEIVDVPEDDDIIVIMASAQEAARSELGEPEPEGAMLQLAEDREMRALLASARAERDARENAAACLLTAECGGPALPPAEWFQDPQLAGPTPLTVTPEGRVFGHIALWDTPHRGFLHYQWSERIFAPRSASAYRQFLTRPLPVACCADAGCGHERQTVMTGCLTFGTLHADKRLSAASAQAFYENSGMQGADVVAGEDAYGPWVAGSLRPGMDDTRVREVLGARPSGDWRWIGGHLELVAVLGVNNEGFPVLASAHVEDGEVRTLIAGWGQAVEPDEALVASIAQLPPGPLGRSRAQRRGMQAELHLNSAAVARELERLLSPRLDRMEADLATLRPLVASELEREVRRLIGEGEEGLDAALRAQHA